MKHPPLSIVLIGGVVLVLGLAVLSLSVGRIWIPLATFLNDADTTQRAILLGLRVPRTLLAMLVGGGLALCGAALQGYTRNPLADPGILGVSPMAALGAVTTLYLGLNTTPWVLPAAAVGGAMLGIVLLLLLARLTGGVVTFLLAGVVLQSLAGAGVALALSLAPNPWAINEIVNWLLGSLQDRSVNELQLATPFVLVGAALIFTTRRALDALTLGETGARALGIELDTTRVLLVLGVGLVAGGCVAVTGVISFVGLVVPHLVRPLVGARPGRLLFPSALGGAALVLAADMLVRLTPAAAELRLGVALSVLGAPFFLLLLVQQRRRLA
ncbi:FecCD family ABC transporter permease [Roseiterribacter gracilis]|uniref:ABC transporter permease n=1 Tax=Roseiterribacter gracilis TaxID=2812848 RepID=A0A8S8XBF9_9PROT|nr:ABC transporter permease [Rhodospirillales bacterium TMPK1]